MNIRIYTQQGSLQFGSQEIKELTLEMAKNNKNESIKLISERVKDFGYCSQCKNLKVITPYYYIHDDNTIMLLCGLHRR